MQPFSLLVKPASADCNLRCPYCFYLDRSALYPETSLHRMSESVLERMVSSYMATDQPAYSFGWQGGEPTLMGVEFFRKVTELQKKCGRPGSVVSNGLQTNATLITDELACHLAEFRFLAGVSLDGPAEVHDQYRVNAAGAGSHASVMKAVEVLRRNQVEFNTLTLVTNASADKAGEIYGWLACRGFLHHQYIPCVEFDDHGKTAPFAVDGEAWGRFLCDLFDAWYPHDTRRISIRLFDSVLHKMVDDRVVVCHLGRDCRQYFVVEHNGDIYPCDFFVRPDLRLGNVFDTTWEQAMGSEVYRRFGALKSEWNARCADCRWQNLCAGDCLKHRFGTPANPRALSHLCVGWRRFFAHTHDRLEQLAAAVRAERRKHAVIPADARHGAGRNDLCPCGSGRKFKKCCGRSEV